MIVANDQAVKRELANGDGVAGFVESYPAIGWYREKLADVVVRKRQLLAPED